MYERVPNFNFRESHVSANGPRTVVMPFVIVAILTGMAVFYWKGWTYPSHVVAPVPDPVVVAEPDPGLAEEPDSFSGPQPDPLSQTSNSLIVSRPDVSEKDFTAWMSSLALDTYLRQKNRGYQGSFWARGNWIRAIEGRWNAGSREFRIALGTMARPGEIDWLYRLDMTGISFNEEIARQRDGGFSLAQSQAYRHPDGTRRFQAVWQRAAESKVAGR